MTFIELQFPLSGSIAEIVLVIEWVLTLLYFEFALIFLNRGFFVIIPFEFGWNGT